MVDRKGNLPNDSVSFTEYSAECLSVNYAVVWCWIFTILPTVLKINGFRFYLLHCQIFSILGFKKFSSFFWWFLHFDLRPRHSVGKTEYSAHQILIFSRIFGPPLFSTTLVYTTIFKINITRLARNLCFQPLRKFNLCKLKLEKNRSLMWCHHNQM